MTLELNKLKKLYEQLDRQQAAGEDVVAELKKEINNLELSYLKEQVFPQVAQFMASKVRNLRCGIDSSFQFDEEQKINYSFCTSESMLFVKDSIDVDAIPDVNTPAFSDSLLDSQLIIAEPDSKLSSKELKIRIENYSVKSVAVYGDTKKISGSLKDLGGFFNSRLRGGPGWVFSKKRLPELEDLLRPYLDNGVSKDKFGEKKSAVEPLYNGAYKLSSCDDSTDFDGCNSNQDGKSYKDSIESQLCEVRIEDYSSKSIVVYGLSNDFKSVFSNLGGYFNKNLKDGPGWVFFKEKKEEVQAVINRLKEEHKQDDITTSDLFSQAHVEIPKVISDDEWIRILLKMKGSYMKGLLTPHKPIFILTIIEMLNRNLLRDNRIFPTKQLANTFIEIWNKYIPDNFPFNPNVYQPFIHLGSESFYSLEKCEGVTSFDINQGWSRGNVIKYVEYGYFDDDFFARLHDKKFSRLLTESLVHKYSLTKVSEINGNLSNESCFNDLDQFERYLRGLKSKKGLPYRPSTINVYTTTLKGKYMSCKVSQFKIDNHLSHIKEKSDLLKLLNSVKQDVDLGVTTPSTLQALRLYYEFRESKDSIRDKNSNSVINPDRIKIIGAKLNENSILSDISNNINEENSVNDPVSKNPNHYSKKSAIDNFESIEDDYADDIKINGKIKSIEIENIHILRGTTIRKFINFINEVGPELVYEMPIRHLGIKLVSKKRIVSDTFKIYNSRPLNNGYWVVISDNLDILTGQIQAICEQLGLKGFMTIEKDGINGYLSVNGG